MLMIIKPLYATAVKLPAMSHHALIALIPAA
jgi:hypothetical protein